MVFFQALNIFVLNINIFKFIYIFLIELIYLEKKRYICVVIKKKKLNNMFYFNVKSIYSIKDYAYYYIIKHYF